jgi:acetylornithine deacetylase/succinyl-diaminopimelate desuccinylase-like protein
MAPPELATGARALGAGRLDDPAIDIVEQSPYFNALIRTTCVATQLRGGGAENALPERARAVVNCRILPQSSPAAVEAVLRDLVAPDGVTVNPVAPAPVGPPSPLDPQVVGPVEAVVAELWPGIPLLPEMSPGASDGIFLRGAGIPTYGVGAVPEDPDDDTSHAPNERIRIAAFHESMEFWYRLMKRVAE